MENTPTYGGSKAAENKRKTFTLTDETHTRIMNLKLKYEVCNGRTVSNEDFIAIIADILEQQEIQDPTWKFQLEAQSAKFTRNSTNQQRTNGAGK